MQLQKTKSGLSREIYRFVRDGFKPSFGRLKGNFKTNPIWSRFRVLGSELWLDTGSIEDAEQFWTQEFSALTTNNTLLNKEVQKGQYDSLIRRAAKMLDGFSGLTEKQRMLELAFILNARHGLRLVERFDAYVSVEEHTALSGEVDSAVEHARRYHAICPERFIVKIPFTPAGLLATRRISAEGIAVNHTLGFSARQNYLTARIARPAYVNVFLGRLNSFVADNKLGDGSYVGERATLASQNVIRKLREMKLTPTLQIGASFRSAGQVRDLAGIDVMTMPPKVAGGFLSMKPAAGKIRDMTDKDYSPGLDEKVEPESIRLDTLWDIGGKFASCIDALEKEDLDSFTPEDLVYFFEKHDCPDVLVRWSDSQIAASTAEGKIPRLENWRDALENKSIGLDSLMNLAGLSSFSADQKEMDQRVKMVLAKR